MDRFLKIPRACREYLGISKAAFYKSSELSALIFKIGRSSVVSELDIQAFIAKHRKLASTDKAA
jgi:hypothetical protein